MPTEQRGEREKKQKIKEVHRDDDAGSVLTALVASRPRPSRDFHVNIGARRSRVARRGAARRGSGRRAMVGATMTETPFTLWVWGYSVNSGNYIVRY